MDTSEDWPEYLRRITGDASGAEISRATGIPPSTVSRWLSGETRPSTDKIAVLQRAYKVDVGQAFTAITYSPAEESLREVLIREPAELDTEQSRAEILRYYSDLELAEEFVRRIDEKDSVDEPRQLPYAVDPDVRGRLQDDYRAAASDRDGIDETDEEFN